MDKKKLYTQLTQQILPFWQGEMDLIHGGFYGRRNFNLQTDATANKSCLMNARYLWSFSHCYRILQDTPVKKSFLTSLKAAATNAYEFLRQACWDQENQGIFWEVTATGALFASHKSTYANSFALYGLSEFYLAFQDPSALAMATTLFDLLEKKTYNPVTNGYQEDFARDWSPIFPQSIGPSNLPELAFTTNTHLHLLEAYTNFYLTMPTAPVKAALQRLLTIFTDNIATPTGCFQFFNASWQPLTQEISFSHDIETSWLLQRTLTVTGITDAQVRALIENLGKQVAANGLDDNGIIRDHSNDLKAPTRKTWWALAEAIIGFYNLYQLTGDETYHELATCHFNMVQRNFIDPRPNSEWYAYLNNDGRPDFTEDIANAWKGPYHTCRMYTEMLTRLP